MIDTVILELNNNQFNLRNDNEFDGVITQWQRGFVANTQYCKEYAEKQKKGENYFPKISLLRRKSKNVLEIQVSLPKLIYGTNLFEINNRNKNDIYKNILTALDKVGVDVSVSDLKEAVVKKVDFSKNIELPDYFGNVRQVIKKLSCFNYKPRSNFTLRDYCDGSEGASLKFYNSSQGYAVYDKLSEIVGRGYTKVEKELTKSIKKQKLKRNIIRFELSLRKKQSLEMVLKRFIKDKQKNFTLDDILNKNLSRGILLETFDKIYNPVNVALVTLGEMGENKLDQYLKTKNLTFRKRVLLFYLVNKCTKIGRAGMLEELKEELRGGSFNRTKKEILEIIEELGEIEEPLHNLIRFLREKHLEFKLFKSPK